MREATRRTFARSNDHWEWRVAAAIGNHRRRRSFKTMGRVACGMAKNCRPQPATASRPVQKSAVRPGADGPGEAHHRRVYPLCAAPCGVERAGSGGAGGAGGAPRRCGAMPANHENAAKSPCRTVPRRFRSRITRTENRRPPGNRPLTLAETASGPKRNPHTDTSLRPDPRRGRQGSSTGIVQPALRAGSQSLAALNAKG